MRSLLVGLVRGLAVMFPEEDWSWIRQIIAAVPDGRAESRRRKQPRIRHVLELFELGIRLTQQAEQQPGLRSVERATLFRDGTIIALLAWRPIRRKNTVGLAIGKHLVRVEGGWRLFLPAAEVKNKNEYDRAIPAEVGLLLDRYLERHRPVLLAQRHDVLETSHAWISQKGTPLSSNGFAEAIIRRTRKAFGKSVNAHLFRDSHLTTWAIELPTKVRAGIHALGNRSFTVAEAAYNMAGSSTAAAKLHTVVASLRRMNMASARLRRRANGTSSARDR